MPCRSGTARHGRRERLVLLAAVCGVFAMATTGRAASDDVYLVKLALRDPAGLVDSPGGSLSTLEFHQAAADLDLWRCILYRFQSYHVRRLPY